MGSRRLELGRVSFALQPSVASSVNKRLETIGESNSIELYNEKPRPSACYHPLEVPKSPHQAMEFLSRTWSPSSSDFFHILSAHSPAQPLENERPRQHDEVLEEQKTDENSVQCNGSTTMRVDHIWMKLEHIKAWMSRDLLNRLSRGFTKKRKEQLRLHMAQVQAALSVARLAAALAGVVSNCSMEPANCNGMSIVSSSGGDLDKKMSTVVATGAALIATVCAEAAEAIGAHRAHVASVINMGLATRSSADIPWLTATAATCLRGAAALELRAAANISASEDEKILAKGAKLPVRTPSGTVQLRMVSIHLKHGKLTLRLGKKYLRALTTYKEYRIIGIMEDTDKGGFSKDARGLFINLGTSEGTIQLLFEDEMQYKRWKTTISHLLSDH